MRVCVISPGVVHAAPRTIAFAPFFKDIVFIDIKGKAKQSELEAKDITYVGPENIARYGNGIAGLQRLLRHLNPDVIVCNYASGDAFFNAIWYGLCPVAAIVMGHDVLYEKGVTHIPWLQRLLIRMGLRRTIYLSAKSQYLHKRIREFGAQCPVDVNYWGANLSAFTRGDAEHSRKLLDIPTSIPVILSPRAIDPTYNTVLIVRSFALILKEWPDALLIIIGRSQHSYLNDVKKTVCDLGIEKNVRLIGEVYHNNVPTYYQAADIAVSMARSEGFPNTLLELMSCETPIIAGNLPQLRELLTDGKDAELVEMKEDSISTKILGLLRSPDRARDIATSARMIAEQNGDIKKNAQAFAAGLRKATSSVNTHSLFQLLLYRAVMLSYLILRRLTLLKHR